MKYFISDLHFCHQSIIEMSQRPFATLEEMHATMIRRWNKVVKTNDQVYIIGDFLYKGTAQEANQILSQLKGKKYLIRGNHEKYLNQPEFDISLFEWVKDYYTFKENKRQYVLFHYPILEWEGWYRDSILLYGHVHNNRSDYFYQTLGPNAVNVGADMLDFTPISQTQVLELVAKRKQGVSSS